MRDWMGEVMDADRMLAKWRAKETLTNPEFRTKLEDFTFERTYQGAA